MEMTGGSNGQTRRGAGAGNPTDPSSAPGPPRHWLTTMSSSRTAPRTPPDAGDGPRSRPPLLRRWPGHRRLLVSRHGHRAGGGSDQVRVTADAAIGCPRRLLAAAGLGGSDERDAAAVDVNRWGHHLCPVRQSVRPERGRCPGLVARAMLPLPTRPDAGQCEAAVVSSLDGRAGRKSHRMFGPLSTAAAGASRLGTTVVEDGEAHLLRPRRGRRSPCSSTKAPWPRGGPGRSLPGRGPSRARMRYELEAPRLTGVPLPTMMACDDPTRDRRRCCRVVSPGAGPAELCSCRCHDEVGEPDLCRHCGTEGLPRCRTWSAPTPRTSDPDHPARFT